MAIDRHLIPCHADGRYFTMVLYKICKKTASSFTLISDIGIGYKSFGIYNRCYYRMDWFHTFLQV